MNLPENYSVGFSAKARDGGIGAKLFLKLGDFKQLIQMIHNDGSDGTDAISSEEIEVSCQLSVIGCR